MAGFFKEKNVIKLPKWSNLVKCANSNEIAPLDPDYMYYKAAAIARILYVKKSKTIGVGSLRAMFGKKQRRGCQPPIAAKAAGKVIRELTKQLKAAGYIESTFNQEQTTSYGLVLTKTGRGELDKIASKIMKEKK